MDNNNLYVIFFLQGNKYAIDCSHITAISSLSNFKITFMPNSVPYIKGLVSFYNSVISIMDLREFFGMQSINSEYNQLIDYIELIKQNYVNMLKELESYINLKKQYKFDSSYFNNKFEQLYNKYDTNISSIKISSDKIDEIHNQLDKFIIKLNNKMNNEQFNTNVVLNYINENFIQKIFVYINKIKEDFKHIHKEILITVSYNKKELGIVIDDIYLMDSLNILCDKHEMNKLNNPQYISGVAKCNNNEDIIMLIDIESLINNEIK